MQAQGDQLCLICVAAGKEISHDCVPASVTCKTVSDPLQICVVCTSPSGQVVDQKCVPLQQTCGAQVIAGQLCLVCQDGNGQVLKTLCPASGGG